MYIVYYLFQKGTLIIWGESTKKEPIQLKKKQHT